MTTMLKSMFSSVLCVMLLTPAVVWGQHEEHVRTHLDVAHGHNHAYPVRGSQIGHLAPEARNFEFRGQHYWFHEGVWYRGYGGGFLVVGPPFGLFVPVLPAFATVVVLGGVTYYYANDTYYLYHPNRNQYEVVDVSASAPTMAAVSPPPAAAVPSGSESIFVYPKNGQSQEMQAKDRYECHRWAADQTGFDPSRGDGGAQARRSDYFRAQQACLEARGYTVR